MKNRMVTNGRSDSIPGGLATGAVISVFLTILISVTMAKLLDTGKLTWEKIGYGILIQTILVTFIGAKVSYLRIKRQRLVVSLLSGGIYYGILLITAALFFGAQYEGMGVTALAVLAGCGSASLLSFPGNQQGKQRMHKKRYC